MFIFLRRGACAQGKQTLTTSRPSLSPPPRPPPKKNSTERNLAFLGHVVEVFDAPPGPLAPNEPGARGQLLAFARRVAHHGIAVRFGGAFLMSELRKVVANLAALCAGLPSAYCLNIDPDDVLQMSAVGFWGLVWTGFSFASRVCGRGTTQPN